MSFDLVSLDDIADVIDSLHKTPKYADKGWAMVRGTDVRYGYLELEKTFKVDEGIYEEFSRRYRPKKDDIIITRVGSYGLTALVNDDAFCLGQNISAIRPKINAKYLYLCLNSNFVRHQIESKVVGTTQKTLSLKAINSLLIPRFGDVQEECIANIGWSLNEKIHNNGKINQTLEKMAQALFKSWFVDFEPVKAKIAVLEAGGSQADATLAAMSAISGKEADALVVLEREHPGQYAELKSMAELFPFAMQDSEVGEIPEGWCADSIKNICDVVDYVANGSFAALKENVNLYDTPNDVLYVRTTDFNNGFSKNLKYTDNESYNFLKKSSLVGTEVIISNVGDVGTVFRPPSWLGMPMTLASNAIAIKSDKLNEFLCLYFKSNIGQHAISSIVTGSAQLKFNKTSFRALKLVLPTDGILNSFNEIAINNAEMLNSLNAKTYTLTQLRDTLLPKLLSGEITLPEAEQAVSEAENV